jgi:hypothetical protein
MIAACGSSYTDGGVVEESDDNVRRFSLMGKGNV